MSGETETNISGWTVDTLHSEIIRILQERDRRYVDRAQSMEQALGQRISDLKSMLQERYETQTKAVDAAFLAQQTAMQTALTTAERAVQTALLAAEKAVGKAELASDKRFESVNEFRAQLADQAATFMPRAENETRFALISEKVDTNIARLAALELRLTSRLDVGGGQTVGREHQRAETQLNNSQMVAIITVIILFVSVGVTILTLVTRH